MCASWSSTLCLDIRELLGKNGGGMMECLSAAALPLPHATPHPTTTNLIKVIQSGASVRSGLHYLWLSVLTP